MIATRSTRTAKLLIDQHGQDALIEAALKADGQAFTARAVGHIVASHITMLLVDLAGSKRDGSVRELSIAKRFIKAVGMSIIRQIERLPRAQPFL